MMLADVQLRLESVSLEVKALRALVAETKEPEGPQFKPRCLLLGNLLQIMGKIVPSLDLEMEATPLDSVDDDMEERDAGPWRTVASTHKKKRNKAPAVIKLKGTPASAKRGSIRQSFVDKTCIIENDMSGREVGKALLKLSLFARFMSLQSKIKTIQEIQTSSSSSSSAEGNGPVEVCG